MVNFAVSVLPPYGVLRKAAVNNASPLVPSMLHPVHTFETVLNEFFRVMTSMLQVRIQSLAFLMAFIFPYVVSLFSFPSASHLPYLSIKLYSGQYQKKL